MDYQKFLRDHHGTDLPGRKSPERAHFEQTGEPPAASGITQGMISDKAFRAILTSLIRSDDALREKDLEWFNANGIEADEMPFDGPVTHTWDGIYGVGGESSTTTTTRPSSGRTFSSEVERMKAEKGLPTDEAMKRVVRQSPDLHKEFLNQNQ
jgi:hypothetical protein